MDLFGHCLNICRDLTARVAVWRGRNQSYPVHVPSLGRAIPIAVHNDAVDPIISRAIKEHGIWEPTETEVVARMVSPGDVFVDVGANIGYFTVLAAKRIGPTGQIYAFEPEEKNFALLRYNVSRNGVRNASLYQAALAETDGEAQLFLSAANLGDHQLYPGTSPQGRKAMQVALRKGDNVFSDGNKIDFLKIDTQGSEGQVLNGLWGTIERSLPRLAILFELTPNALRRANVNGRDLIRRLSELGFQFLLLHKGGLLSVSPDLIGYWIDIVHLNDQDDHFLNVLCVSKERLDELDAAGLAFSPTNSYDALLGDIVEVWDGQLCDRSGVGRFILLLGWRGPSVLSDRCSEIYFKLGSERRAPRALQITGLYEGAPFEIDVTVNGEYLGRHVLNGSVLKVPAAALASSGVVVSLKPCDDAGGSEFHFEEIRFGAADEAYENRPGSDISPSFPPA